MVLNVRATGSLLVGLTISDELKGEMQGMNLAGALVSELQPQGLRHSGLGGEEDEVVGQFAGFDGGVLQVMAGQVLGDGAGHLTITRRAGSTEDAPLAAT